MKNTVVGRVHSVSSNNRKKLANFTYAHSETQLDSLTGLTNKMHTQHLITTYLHNNPNSNCALFVIDVDNFKSVNDTNGHLFGDTVLTDISAAIKSTFRSTDVVGRIGGDEFMVLMKDYRQLSDVIDKANSLKHAIRKTYVGDGDYIVSVSVGISLFKEHGTDFDTLYVNADNAMYFNKNNGKDGYTIYSPDNKDISSGGRSGKKKDDGYTTFNKKTDKKSRTFEYELMDFTFKIMEDSKEVDNAINLLLRKVTEHYGISLIAIREVTEAPYTLRYIYEYIEEEVKKAPRIGKVWTFTEKEWSKILSHYSNGYYLWQSTDEAPLDCDIMDYPGHFKTFMEVPIYSDNSFIGCIDFIDIKKNTLFTTQDISTLKMFCRIISSYLMNMRALNKTESLVEQMNAHDALTGLLKYDYFSEKMQPFMVAPRPCRIALTYSDILHFKYINETYGYAVGDELIKYFVEETIEQDHMAFIAATRVYSDNILSAVLIDDSISNEEFLNAVIEKNLKTQEAIHEKFFNAQVSISTGIYIIDKDEDILLETAVSNANSARKEAKLQPTKNCILFDSNMMDALTNSMKLSAEFYTSMENGEFVVFYQPKIESGTTKICGAEALIRWIKPDGSMIFPNEFIPLFESNGLIIELDYFVYREVFKYIRKRLDNDLPVVPISMNISRLHLLDDALIDYIRILLDEYKIPTEYIEFELTESIYMDNMEQVLDLMKALSELGIQVSMDDFGSGYSSLNVLNSIPIDTLKLDRVFLSDATLNDKQLIILASVIEMAKKLHISVLCEGVEYDSQCDILYKLGCNVFQGYYYSKPLPEAAFNQYTIDHFVSKANYVHFPLNDSFEDTTGQYKGIFYGDRIEFEEGPFESMGSFHFPGGTMATNLIELPPELFPISDFSVSMWVKLDAINIWTSLFYLSFAKGFCSLIPHAFDGRPSLRFKPNNEDVWYDTGSSTNISTNKWYHVVSTYNSKTGISGLYVNGELFGSRTDIPFMNGPLRILLGGDVYQDSFAGNISDFKIFDQALSSNDVLKEYLTYVNKQ